MAEHNLPDLNAITTNADGIVAWAARTCVFAHLAYSGALDEKDVNPVLNNYLRKLRELRSKVTSQIDAVSGLLGVSTPDPETAPVAAQPDEYVSHEPAPPKPMTQLDKLKIWIELEGGITNAGIQKHMTVDAAGATRVLKQLVEEGFVTKETPKFYKWKAPVQ